MSIRRRIYTITQNGKIAQKLDPGELEKMVRSQHRTPLNWKPHLVHSSGSKVHMLSKAKANSPELSLEVRAHHAALTAAKKPETRIQWTAVLFIENEKDLYRAVGDFVADLVERFGMNPRGMSQNMVDNKLYAHIPVQASVQQMLLVREAYPTVILRSDKSSGVPITNPKTLTSLYNWKIEIPETGDDSVMPMGNEVALDIKRNFNVNIKQIIFDDSDDSEPGVTTILCQSTEEVMSKVRKHYPTLSIRRLSNDKRPA